MARLPHKYRRQFLAALDIGCSKICAFIAKIDDTGRPRVIGVGYQIAHGLKAGNIVDMAAVEHSILNAVHTAEQMAGETIKSVYVNVSGGQPLSHMFEVDMPLQGQEVREADLRKLLEQGRGLYENRDAVSANDNLIDRQMIHTIPVSYNLDSSRGIRDPRGMYGQRLGANVHIISAQNGPLRNLMTCVQRCHLDIDGYVISPYASGLATLVEDEIDLGVTLIDMGGGTTSFAVFFDGNVIYTDSIPIGSISLIS
jgi:cell division protein FtsA